MRYAKWIAIGTTIATTACTWADTLHVPDDYATIQDAINAALDGDTVLVADGIYTGDGNRGMTFGGKAITVMSESGPDACIIDVQGDESNPHRAFNGISSAGVLDGFTIRNGHEKSGGAILCGNSPEIRNCIFESNTGSGGPAYGEGGGAVNVALGNPSFINCIFRENSSTAGGAITVSGESFAGGSVSLIGCVLEGNEAEYGGGAISVGAFASAYLFDCTLLANTARFGGAIGKGAPGGVVAESCRFIENAALDSDGGAIASSRFVTLVNCLFDSNYAAGSGGAAAIRNSSIINSTFVGNTSSTGAAVHYNGGTPEVANSIFWGNEPDQIVSGDVDLTVTYSDVQGGWSGEGNIDLDPMLTDDRCLDAFSPCIDGADNAAVPEGVTTDLAGLPRFVDDPWTTDTGVGSAPIVDMGAKEFQGSSCPADCNDDGALNILDFVCYQILFQSGDAGADCNADGALNILDFVCFQGAFQVGCP